MEKNENEKIQNKESQNRKTVYRNKDSKERKFREYKNDKRFSNETDKLEKNDTNTGHFDNSKPTQPLISKEKLLEAGVYFGHKSNLWNPKMKPFIHSKKMNTHIIDIAQTKSALENAYKIIKTVAQKGASFIFVGTKKTSQRHC